MPKRKRLVIDREVFMTGLDEIEAYTGHGRKFLIQEAKRGRLRMARINGKWTTSKQACNEWLERLLRQEAPGSARTNGF